MIALSPFELSLLALAAAALGSIATIASLYRKVP